MAADFQDPIDLIPKYIKEWKNGNKIQARYYWNYVLKLESTEDNLKKTLEKKLIQGL